MSVQENPTEENYEVVTLVLKDERWKVNKQMLIRKSGYFAALLSSKFSDHRRQEQVIHYDISRRTLQDFITWVNEDKTYVLETDQLIKYCPGRYTFCNLKGLLKMLQLSILFTADQLTEDIINVIERCWLKPQHVIKIWLIAQELGLRVLENIALALCLNQFENLQVKKLAKLPYSQFKKLVGNINLKSEKCYLQDVVSEWNKYNNTTLSINVPEERKQKLLNFTIGLEVPENDNSKIYLFCWDGNRFYEHSAFNYPREIQGVPSLTGMQCTGTGFDIYLCGGEYGIGTGRFNRKLWRYSLISKKWCYLSFIPAPRRHMIFVAVQNKLLLVAGTGQFRIKISTVDIYDIPTQSWSKGMELYETFSSIPDHCTSNDKLIIYIPSHEREHEYEYQRQYECFLIYPVNKNIWFTVNPGIGSLNTQIHIPLVEYGIDTCYIEMGTKTYSGKMILITTINDAESVKCREMAYSGQMCENVTLCVITPKLTEDCETLFYGKLLNGNYIFLLVPSIYRVPLSLHVHSSCINNIETKVPQFFTSNSSIKRFFHMINPIDLHTELNIFEHEKIDCNNVQSSNLQNCNPSTSNNHLLNQHLSNDLPSSSLNNSPIRSSSESPNSLSDLSNDPLCLPLIRSDITSHKKFKRN